jgi:hypothetical protein
MDAAIWFRSLPLLERFGMPQVRAYRTHWKEYFARTVPLPILLNHCIRTQLPPDSTNMQYPETLTSLAMLKVNTDEGRDYFDYLLPFVRFVLGRSRPDPVSDTGTQLLLREEFGLALPVHAVAFVLQRLAKRGSLKRQDGVFHITDKFEMGDISQKRVLARQQQGAVVKNLMKYAKEQHGIVWSEIDASDAIVSYLSRFSVECLKTFTQGSALPELLKDEVKDFIVSSFVKSIHDYSPELFNAFVGLVKGHMLANALLCRDLDALQKQFSGVVFFLDTPFLMNLFRFWGEPAFAAAKELIDLLLRLKGTVALFEHTADEVERVIAHCEANVENTEGVKRPMLASLRREGITVSDLACLRGGIDRFYRSHQIEVRPAPAYFPEHQVDEQALATAIDEEIDYFNPKALANDVNSIRSIYALRKSKHPTRVEDALAVLVTSNVKLAFAALEFGKQCESTREVSPVITDFSLANIAWLKSPMGSPDLPRLELIAECYAAMEPRAILWGRFVEEIDRLKSRGNISPDEHELLRLSAQARDELMHLTLGSEKAFSAGTITTILSRVKAELLRQKNVELDRERTSHGTTLQVLTAAAEQAHQKDTELRKKLYWISYKLSSAVEKLCFAACVALLIASVVAGSSLISQLPTESLLATVGLHGVLLVGSVWAVASGINGMTVSSLSKQLASWCQTQTLRKLHLYFGVNSHDDGTASSKNKPQ